MRDYTRFRVFDRDAGELQGRPRGLIELHLGFFIQSLRSHQGGLGNAQVVLRQQRVVARLGAEYLFLLGDVEGVLREIDSLLRGNDSSLRLLQRKLRVTHVEENVLLLLLKRDLALPNCNTARN